MTAGEKKEDRQLELRVSIGELARAKPLKRAGQQMRFGHRNNRSEPVGKANTSGEIDMTELTKEELVSENRSLKSEIQKQNEKMMRAPESRIEVSLVPRGDVTETMTKTFLFGFSAATGVALGFAAVGGLTWGVGKLAQMAFGGGGGDGGGNAT